MKKWHESLTIRGLIVVVVGAVVSATGAAVDVELVSDTILELIGAAIQLVGVVAAYLGRA